MMRAKAEACSRLLFGYAESDRELNRRPQGAGNRSLPVVMKIELLQALSALLGHLATIELGIDPISL